MHCATAARPLSHLKSFQRTGTVSAVQRKNPICLLATALLFATASNLPAQGTAFFYQGRLNDSGAPANASYDFRFAVYDAATNGNRISIYQTNAAVPVSNGLFTATLDFGPGVFNGTPNGSNDWLDLGVRAVGAANFATLAPRQPILPVPYAQFATSASNLLGRVPSALFSGTYSNGVNFSNGTNIFVGVFSGKGIGLTNLNASNVSTGTLADARLSANVDLLNANQTLTGAKTFSAATALSSVTVSGTATFSGSSTFNGQINSTAANTFGGINSFNNLGNSFSGSFFGNGLVGWLVTNNIAFTAQFDHGYVLTSAQLTTVTLPASVNAGDIIRIAGAGAGGWLVKGNTGQTILGTLASYANAQLAQIAGSDYSGVAASADGVRLFAVGNSINGVTGVNGSTDAGHTWNPVGSLSGSYNSVACSANGKIIYAQQSGGSIQQSTDGVSWTSAGSNTGKAIACTATGTLLTDSTYGVACSGNGNYRAHVNGGTVQVSINNGAFTSVSALPSGSATCVACSSDCTKLVAGVNGGKLYASANQGATWTTLTTTNQAWSGAWMSPDGSKFAATVNQSGGIGGSIFYCNVSALPNTVTTSSTGSLGGSQGSAVELQYIGGSQFIVVGSSGLIWAN